MSKNHLMNVLFTAIVLFGCLTRFVCADVAPDPITRAVGILPIILIAVVIFIAFLLIKKFLSK